MYSCVMVSNDYISGKPSFDEMVCFTKITDLYYNYTKNAVASYIVSDSGISADTVPCDDSDSFFVFCGAFPFVVADTLDAIYNQHIENNSNVTVVTVPDDQGKSVAGIYLIKRELLTDFSDVESVVQSLIDNSNRADEYETDEITGFCVFDCLSLADANNIAHTDICSTLMSNGVVLVSPETTYISYNSEISPGTTIMPNTIIKDNTKIGSACVIGPNTQITNCKIADNVTVNSSVLMESIVEEGATIGPFAYIRPNSRIGNNVKIGDFVEIKNATLEEGTKVSHLTYVGDADVGKHVNFGCGTVLVNYDGKNKFRSTIEDDAFIGCNTNLVSPVTVHKGAFIAAGSTITEDIPDNSLAIARARQVNKLGWKRNKEEKK